MVLKNIHAYQSRLKLFISSFADFLIINCIIYINTNKEALIFGPRQYFYILTWILISYIFDRYHQEKFKNEKFKFINQFINTLKSLIIFSCVLLFFNWLLGNYLS